jgi:hypothetical protein
LHNEKVLFVINNTIQNRREEKLLRKSIFIICEYTKQSESLNIILPFRLSLVRQEFTSEKMFKRNIIDNIKKAAFVVVKVKAFDAIFTNIFI